MEYQVVKRCFTLKIASGHIWTHFELFKISDEIRIFEMGMPVIKTVAVACHFNKQKWYDYDRATMLLFSIGESELKNRFSSIIY